MREATNKPVTTLKELKASAAEEGETVALWESGKEKTTVEEISY